MFSSRLEEKLTNIFRIFINSMIAYFTSKVGDKGIPGLLSLMVYCYWSGILHCQAVKWISTFISPFSCLPAIPWLWECTEVLTMRLLVVSCAPVVSSFTLSLACLLLTAITVNDTCSHGLSFPLRPLVVLQSAPSPSLSVFPVFLLSSTHSHTWWHCCSDHVSVCVPSLPTCQHCFDVFPTCPCVSVHQCDGWFLVEPDISLRWRWHIRWVT